MEVSKTKKQLQIQSLEKLDEILDNYQDHSFSQRFLVLNRVLLNSIEDQTISDREALNLAWLLEELHACMSSRLKERALCFDMKIPREA
ncbi:hypothetical protein N7E81_11585 [Reichenbachiella carrageenanivorans]|uniref:Uncharacterized protein n=1 Tax=Reichenbachiella carrageenanivorans TaxID=2979869 RepID=A0ABY6CVR6_9BACT|nr:hypothetical protein [Reichenbachiella carrageenanivorans]UXX78002.1 hypothetical protein N7E81_11585 [Reichenbachiella carrageenanivorans]